MPQDPEKADFQPPIDASSITIKSPSLKAIERSFLQNLNDLKSLLVMPRLMVSFTGVVRKMFGIAAVQAALTTIEKENTQQAVVVRLFDNIDEFIKDHRGFGEIWSKSEEELQKMCQHPSYGPILTASMNVLKAAAVSGSWTVFECAAGDCWVAALNQNPIPLAQRAIGSLPRGDDPSDISSKQIPVGLAAKYNFDLRGCLGTILRSRFDFTSVGGVKNAFEATFKGIKGADAVQDVLNDPVLRELEITRNLIVHRAGVIDEEYNRQLSSRLPIGQALELSTAKVDEFVTRSAVAAAAVLLFVDDWLDGSTQGQR